jgi:hypothetical protein
MLEEIVRSVSFFSFLYNIDKEMAEAVRSRGCPLCGGRLDSGKYRSKPRGSPVEIPEEYCERLSLCCSSEGCRSRVLAPSCLFMGRRVYWGAIVLLVVGLRQGRQEGFTARKIRERYGVTRNTLQRWMRYFREEFSKTEIWKRRRGRLGAWVKDGDIAEFLEHFVSFSRDSTRGFASALLFLSGGEERTL